MQWNSRRHISILFSVSARRCDAPTCSRVKVVLLVRRAGWVIRAESCMHRVLGVRVHRTRDDRCSCKRDAGSSLRSFPVHVGRLRLHSACINPRDQHREAPSSAMPNIAFARTAARTRDGEEAPSKEARRGEEATREKRRRKKCRIVNRRRDAFERGHHVEVAVAPSNAARKFQLASSYVVSPILRYFLDFFRSRRFGISVPRECLSRVRSFMHLQLLQLRWGH